MGGQRTDQCCHAKPKTHVYEDSSLAPRCSAARCYWLNPPRGPSLPYDWAPAQLPFGTLVPCWPWNLAPNHSCLAWGLTICPRLARLLLSLWRAETCHPSLPPAAVRGPASTVKTHTDPASVRPLACCGRFSAQRF